MAGTPALFAQRRQPAERYLALPEVSSVNRRIIPGAFLDPDVIAGNKLIAFPGADLWHFGLLQAAHFTAWVGAVSGRLKNDYNVSPSLSYLSFPFPRPHRGPRAAGHRCRTAGPRRAGTPRRQQPGRSVRPPRHACGPHRGPR